MKHKKKNQEKTKQNKNFSFYLAIFLILVILGFVLSTITLPRDLRLKLENMRFVSKVYDHRGKLIGNLFSHRRIWVPADKISPQLKKAVIAIEDTRYYRHIGVDPIGITRAVYHALKPGGIKQGGSTITQQLAKISLLTLDRTFSRKLQDIFYAFLIERTYTKEEILELYLNSINLAHGNVGVEAAARYYFGKSANNLKLEEAALIAGIIRSPENYSPFKHLETAKKRRNLVLQKMLEQEFITEAQYKKAVNQDIKLVTKQEAIPIGAYFLDYLREVLVKEGFTEEELLCGGYNIHTTLDLDCQQKAEQVMKTLPQYSAKVQPEAALVTLDPTTGGILAMTGGRDYTTSPLNRSVKAYRQPGSALKPFIYATALEKNYTAASILEDKPITYLLQNGEEWTPENNDHEFLGKITLRQALRESVNTIAVQLVDELGITTVANQLEKMGIHSLVRQGKVNDLAYAPLALGGLTKGVTPLELAAAYTSFANQGNYVKPHALTKITDPQGKVLKSYKPAKGIPVISPQTAYIMTMLMQDVIEKGTGWRAQLPNRPAAGKTGTTNAYTNAWFVGYTPEYLTAVWIGNDRQEEPMRYQEGVIGGGTAAQLWGTYMQRITSGLPVQEFPEPPGIIWANVDPVTGKAVPSWAGKNTYKEVFAENKIPESTAFKIWRWFTSWPKKSRPEEPPGSTGETLPETEEKKGEPENSWGQGNQLEQKDGPKPYSLPPLELLNFSY